MDFFAHWLRGRVQRGEEKKRGTAFMCPPGMALGRVPRRPWSWISVPIRNGSGESGGREQKGRSRTWNWLPTWPEFRVFPRPGGALLHGGMDAEGYILHFRPCLSLGDLAVGRQAPRSLCGGLGQAEGRLPSRWIITVASYVWDISERSSLQLISNLCQWHTRNGRFGHIPCGSSQWLLLPVGN